MFLQLAILYLCSGYVFSLSNTLFTIVDVYDNISLDNCGSDDILDRRFPMTLQPSWDITYKTINTKNTQVDTDPWKLFQKIILKTVYGKKIYEMDAYVRNYLIKLTASNLAYPDYGPKTSTEGDNIKQREENTNDILLHFPTGNVMRAELFQNKSTVHLPMEGLLHRGHCRLKMTEDYMQTAVDAFAIMISGSISDVMQLPGDYVLRSARAIAMMKISIEKRVATWIAVKGARSTEAVTYEELEMYRPLFKYLSGREISRLNLSDDKILNYIGTHADLDRHQVGVVASRYVKLNPNWQKPKYLNLLNNLLCGIPMTYMRKVSENTYLQLTHQVFYHVRACDPLQRRFYLAMMTRTQALGKSYSWSARDVARLGLLLSEVEGSELSAVVPEAMSGITAQVMLEIPAHTLNHITEMQLRYIQQKPLNILAKKLQSYRDQIQMFNNSHKYYLRYCFMLNVLLLSIICSVVDLRNF